MRPVKPEPLLSVKNLGKHYPCATGGAADLPCSGRSRM